MRRPYVRYSGPDVTDDGYRVRRALSITADPPGGTRLWWNMLGGNFRRSVRRVLRELRES